MGYFCVKSTLFLYQLLPIYVYFSIEMNHLSRFCKKTLFLAVLTAFISCGNEILPTGGDRDTMQPKIEEISPYNLTTNFSSRSIKFNFDEFVVVNKPNENIFVSPPLKYPLKTVVKGKRLYIAIKDTLQKDLTYQFIFNNAIKDYNEGNKIPYYNYTISTGDNIDSLSFGGKVVNAYSGNGEKNVLVILHKDLADSNIQSLRPHYITKTDDNGRFSFEYLKEGTYAIYSLKDENKNYLFDLSKELLAFRDSLVVLDSTIDSISLRLFKEENDQFFVSKKIYKGLGHFAFVLNENYSGLTMETSLSSYSVLYSKDTMHLWLNTFVGDTVSFHLKGNNELFDTIPVFNPEIGLDSIKKLNKPLLMTSISQDKILPMGDSLVVIFNRPITAINSKKIRVKENGLLIKNVKTRKISDFAISLNYNWLYASDYQFVMNDSMVLDYYGQPSDSLGLTLKTLKQENYSTLQLNFSNGDTARVVEILKKKTVIDSLFIDQNDTVFYPYFKDGEYIIRVTDDINRNRQWDTGNFDKRIQPERVYQHPTKISIPKNFDIELDIDL